MNIIYLLISFLVALIIVPIFRKIAKKYNVVDKPDSRKIHKNPWKLNYPLIPACRITLLLFNRPSESQQIRPTANWGST